MTTQIAIPTQFQLQSNGLRHNLVRFGSPSAEQVILCLHGFLDNARSWDFIASHLLAKSNDFQVVALDFRGHGQSEWAAPGCYYHFVDYVADIDGLITSINAKNLHIVAHSMGGNVATYWAGARPDSLKTLSLLESVIVPDSDYSEGPERMLRWLDQLQSLSTKNKRVMNSLQEVAQRLKGTMPHLDDKRALYLAQFSSRPVEGGFQWRFDPKHRTRGPTGYRLEAATAFWKKINCPVLMLEGERSFFLPDDLQERYRQFMDVRRGIVSNAGHALHVEQPETVATHIMNHILAHS